MALNEEPLAVSPFAEAQLSGAQFSGAQFSRAQQQIRVEAQWMGAIAALTQLLQTRSLQNNSQTNNQNAGLLISGPVPVLDPTLFQHPLSTWTFTATAMGTIPKRLEAADARCCSVASPTTALPLLPDDPQVAEQFCLVLTSEFSLALAMGEGQDGRPTFYFSFDPHVIEQVWRSLEVRLLLTSPYSLKALGDLYEQFAPVTPHYRTVTQFSRWMLAQMPDLETIPVTEDRMRESFRSVMQASESSAHAADLSAAEELTTKPLTDTELLQAIAHEVRTPLTTIRTMTRLLLRRKDLSPDVLKRLEIIDQECTEQIDRFTLIFRAVELQTSHASSQSYFSPISLSEVFQSNIPRWQQQAAQHGHTLEVLLPSKMPMVLTDPTMLDQALTGLIDRLIHTQPAGSQIQLRVSLAGHQLKLQIEPLQVESLSEASADGDSDTSVKCGFSPAVQSLGELLMFQPETGNLSLNMTVTKSLFQAMGGKLIVRQRPQQGEELTVFLPLETRTV
jgi:signal transduction histidine kinase